MARLLMRHSIVELEQLFLAAKGDTKALQSLEDELKHRNVPRAVGLMDKVQRALRAAKSPYASESAATPTISSASPKDTIFNEEPSRTEKTATTKKESPQEESLSVVAPTEFPTKPSTPTTPPVKQVEAAPLMEPDEAYKVLKASPTSTWEAIEHIRRQLVQRSHPDMVVGLSPEHRVQVQADAKRANAAHAVLLKLRAGDGRE